MRMNKREAKPKRLNSRAESSEPRRPPKLVTTRAGAEWKKLGSRGLKLPRLKIRKKEKKSEKTPKISFLSDNSLSSEFPFLTLAIGEKYNVSAQ